MPESVSLTNVLCCCEPQNIFVQAWVTLSWTTQKGHFVSQKLWTRTPNAEFEIKQDPNPPPYSAPGTKSLSIPYFLFGVEGFSLLGLLCVSKSRLKQLLIKEVEECRNQGKQSRNKSSAINWALVPPQGMYTTIWHVSLICSAWTKTPTQADDGD